MSLDWCAQIACNIDLPIKNGCFDVACIDLVIELVVSQFCSLCRTCVVIRVEVRITVDCQHDQDNDQEPAIKWRTPLRSLSIGATTRAQLVWSLWWYVIIVIILEPKDIG